MKVSRFQVLMHEAFIEMGVREAAGGVGTGTCLNHAMENYSSEWREEKEDSFCKNDSFFVF